MLVSLILCVVCLHCGAVYVLAVILLLYFYNPKIILLDLKIDLLLDLKVSRTLFGNTHKTRYLIKQNKGNIESIFRQIIGFSRTER